MPCIAVESTSVPNNESTPRLGDGTLEFNGTLCVHGGVSIDDKSGAVLTPIVQSTAYEQPSVEKYLSKGYSYSRCGNPTVDELQKKIAVFENARYPAIVNTSGMASLNCLFSAFLKAGDHVVMTKCSYGGTNRASRVLYQRQYGIEFDFVDMTNLDAVRKAIIPGRTKLIFSETPCNPTLQLADIAAISGIAKQASDTATPEIEEILEDGDGPSRKPLNGRIIHVCDSTLATPLVVRALDFGADVALISLTKFYDGHNMNLGGALVTNDKDLYEHLKFKQNIQGSIMNPTIAFQMMQTMKTMAIRVTQQCQSAMVIARYLATHSKVKSVNYPGLPSDPQYPLALRLHKNGFHGGLLCFEVHGGTEAGVRVMNAAKRPLTLAENLGSTETIVTCPAVFTHANMPREMREDVNITDGLIRLSVGIEETRDIIQALNKALQAA